MVRLMIIEDDRQLNNALKIYFENAGYLVLSARDTAEARRCLMEKSVDLILADIHLPGESGLVFCRQVRKERGIPVVFLTGKDEEEDILEGYEAGCEEYVIKPVSPRVLFKKIEAVLKRNTLPGDVLLYGDLKIDYEKRRVWRREAEIKVTGREWKILDVLSRNKGKIVSKEMLLERVWDREGNFVDDHAIAVTINRLRKKIEEGEGQPVYIKNIFGVGYTFGE